MDYLRSRSIGQLSTIHYQLLIKRAIAFCEVKGRSRASMDNGQLTMDNYQLFTINY